MGDGNASQCVVTKAAFDKAHYALRDEFEAEEDGARREVEERRKTEQTLLTDPLLPPQLFDERQWWNKPRSADVLAAAEERLRSLNFEKEVSENVIAYKLWHEGRLVLADPRTVGRITFRVFNSEKPKKGSKQASFDLLDGWKNNLAEKFQGHLLIPVRSYQSEDETGLSVSRAMRSNVSLGTVWDEDTAAVTPAAAAALSEGT